MKRSAPAHWQQRIRTRFAKTRILRHDNRNWRPCRRGRRRRRRRFVSQQKNKIKFGDQRKTAGRTGRNTESISAMFLHFPVPQFSVIRFLHPSDRRTDGRTPGYSTYTALCICAAYASRGKNDEHTNQTAGRENQTVDSSHHVYGNIGPMWNRIRMLFQPSLSILLSVNCVYWTSLFNYIPHAVRPMLLLFLCVFLCVFL